LTTDVLQNNPRCQDVELNFAVRNQQNAVASQRKLERQSKNKDQGRVP
jgi:hypothetical protein